MNQRNLEIDLTKGILALGMILSHTIGLLGNGHNPLLAEFKRITNLVSFSGFLFCFGYAFWVAYLQKPQLPWQNVLKTIVKCYVAFVICAIAFRALVYPQKINFNLAFKVIAIRDVPSFSEFLLAFAVITALALLLAKLIRVITNNWQNLILATGVCLAFTFLPSRFHYDPLIGSLIGGTGFNYFPAVQYFPLFLLGIFSARHNPQLNRWLYLGLAISGVILFAALSFLKLGLERFPPSAAWLICSVGIFLLYRGAAHLAATSFPRLIQRYLNVVGQNTLMYLVLSNLFIFTGAARGLRGQLNSIQVSGFFLVVLGFILFIQWIAIDLKRANQAIA